MKKILLVLFCLANLAFISNVFADENKFFIIIDAGSSGTRLHVFKHNHDKTMPIIEEVYSEKNTMPLAQFGDKPEKAFEVVINPLLENAVAKIRDKHIATPVPISILGTAGMRLLPSDLQQQIYHHIKTEVNARYPITLKPESIQTVSGKMEGIYGWLDINYLLKNFQNKAPTAGSIDIGGASTQITFATDKTSKSIDEISLSLNEKNYIIYSKSFLGLGMDQARASMNIDENAGFCYPKNYDTETQKGKFHIASCSIIYSQVIDNYHIDKLGMPTYKTPIFIAYSGAYNTYHFFGIDPYLPDQETLEQTIILPVCSNNWETLKEAYPSEPEAYLANHCSNSVFLTNLLYGAFQLQHKQINVLSAINDSKVDWTLGAMIYNIITSES